MHRRQYIPGSHVKVSRAALAQQNTDLHGALDRVVAYARSIKATADHLAQEKHQRETTGLRGFVNRLRGFFGNKRNAA